MQEVVRSGRVQIGKVWGMENVADHLTKGKSVADFGGLLERVGAVVVMKAGSVGGVWDGDSSRDWRDEGIDGRRRRSGMGIGRWREGGAF